MFSPSPQELWGLYRTPFFPTRGFGITTAFPWGLWGHYSTPPPHVPMSLQCPLLSPQELWGHNSIFSGVGGHYSAPSIPPWVAGRRSAEGRTHRSMGAGGDQLSSKPTDLWGEKGSKEAMFLPFTLFPYPKTPQFHPISLWGAGQEAVSSPSHFSPTLKHSDPIAHPYWVFPGRATFPHFTPFPHPKTAQSHQSPL